MTDSRSEPAPDTAPGDGPGEATDGAPAEETEAPAEETGALAAFASAMAERAGATSFTTDHDTVRLAVDRGRWVDAVTAVGEELPFFSWLSAIDWSRQVTVGEPAEGADQLEERFEVLCRMSSVESADGVVLVAAVPKDDPWIDTLAHRFGGAEWHEREAAEMFGIDFRGHPNLTHLYLPDAFEGHPLRKSYALLSRHVKPWPGTVDVEAMPSAENVEAGDTGGETAEGGDQE